MIGEAFEAAVPSEISGEVPGGDAVEAGRQAQEAMEGPQADLPLYEEVWTGDYVFENEWQSFRTKKDRSLELKSVARECAPGRRKIAVKVVDIFGNDTMKIIEVTV